MGPFPHDAPPATINDANPAGTDGFEFVEFAHPDPQALEKLFWRMGYTEVARHKTKDISLYRQGGINYVINREPNTHAARFIAAHGPCAPAMAGAWSMPSMRSAARSSLAPLSTPAPTRRSTSRLSSASAARSFISSIPMARKSSPYQKEFEWLGEADPTPKGVGFYYLDHLTHNVRRGNMNTWYRFYAKTFNFREIRFFNIEGKLTGLHSRALTSPCGKIRIPINESADDKSQIEEYLREYRGEGIQHIAVGTDDTTPRPMRSRRAT